MIPIGIDIDPPIAGTGGTPVRGGKRIHLAGHGPVEGLAADEGSPANSRLLMRSLRPSVQWPSRRLHPPGEATREVDPPPTGESPVETPGGLQSLRPEDSPSRRLRRPSTTSYDQYAESCDAHGRRAAQAKRSPGATAVEYGPRRSWASCVSGRAARTARLAACHVPALVNALSTNVAGRSATAENERCFRSREFPANRPLGNTWQDAR